MKTHMISFMALALLASGCMGEHGLEEGTEEGYAADDEGLVGEELAGGDLVTDEPARAEAQHSGRSAGIPGGPPRQVLEGKRTIVCAGIKWPNVNRPGATDSACNSLVHKLADYYHRNSRGLFTLVPVPGHTVEVPFLGNPHNVYKAENIVVNKFNADFYVVPSIFTHPHSGAHVAHVKSAQFMTAAHETGHLLGLGHAGQYSYSAKGKPSLDHYGDHDSIMGNLFSNYLTPPQYYYLGWLPDEEVAIYDPAHGPYDVKRISAFETPGLATVIVPPPGGTGRFAFIGALRCPKNTSRTCVTLHLANGGGSQKVAEAHDEIYDEHFTGLHIKVLDDAGETVSLAIDHAQKP